MSRSKITSPSKDLVTDTGSVLFSMVEGEQFHFSLTLQWLTNISQYTITAKVVEAHNDGVGTRPSEVAENPVITTLTTLETDDSDNMFKLVIPSYLIENWAVKPKPNYPVYGFMDLEIKDTGTGYEQQIWKPVRGLVEIMYSPTQEGA
jgi:hypothetical protein